MFKRSNVVTDDTVRQAIELTKIAVAGANGPWIGYPAKVTEFIEAIAKKLQELKHEPS
jgi:hypothetical protein